MIDFACPNCGKGFHVDDALAGKQAKCRACGHRLTVPPCHCQDDVTGTLDLASPAIDIESPSERAKRMAGGHRNEQTQNANTDRSAVEVRCPKCGCDQVHASRQGYDVASGVAGGLMFGILGAAAGAADKDKVWITCLNCRSQWRPGEKTTKQDREAAFDAIALKGCLVVAAIIVAIIILGSILSAIGSLL